MPTAPPTFRPPRINAKTFGYNQATRKQDAALAAAQKVYNTKRWQRLRRLVLSKQPLCADIYSVHAQAGQAVLATQVDHITRLVDAPASAYAESNLQGLCTACHARKSQEERQKYDRGRETKSHTSKI